LKYTAKHYAQALHDALENAKTGNERKNIVRQFMAALCRNRASMQLERILAAFEKYYLAKRGLKKIEITTASGLEDIQRKEIMEIVGKNATFDEIIRPDLLAGVTFTIDGELMIDATAKRRLNRLFVR
jgi:F0F1-type ATP synthase delta subunit